MLVLMVYILTSLMLLNILSKRNPISGFLKANILQNG